MKLGNASGFQIGRETGNLFQVLMLLKFEGVAFIDRLGFSVESWLGNCWIPEVVCRTSAGANV